MEKHRKAPCRVIDLIGVVDDKMLAEFSERMKEINAYDLELMEYNAKVKKEYKIPYETIRINLATPGGSVVAGVGIMGLMDEAIAPIHVHILGDCMSMGIHITAHADTRSAVKFSSFMIHGMSTGTWGYLDEGIDSLDYFKSLEKDLNLELTKRTKYTLEELEKYTNVAHFFNYQEALDKGLLTKDIYDTTPQPRFEREEFVECIKDDLEHGMSIDDIVEAFEGDELYESEWDIVLDILAKIEKEVLEDEHLKEVEEVKKEIEDAENDEDEDVCEDNVEDIEDNQFEEAKIEVNNLYTVNEDIVINEEDIEYVDITFQEFITILDMHFDDVKHVLNGDYTAEEVVNYLQENIQQFSEVDEQVLINYLVLICTEEDDDE